MDGLVNINPSILRGVSYFYTTKTQGHKDLNELDTPHFKITYPQSSAVMYNVCNPSSLLNLCVFASSWLKLFYRNILSLQISIKQHQLYS